MKKLVKTIILIVLYVFLYLGCKEKSIKHNYKHEHKNNFTAQWFRNIEIENLARCSDEGICTMFIKGDTLDMSSSGKLIYEPFRGKINTIESFERRYGNVFFRTKQIEIDTNGNKYEIILLKFKNSYIKLLKNTYIPPDAEELAEYHYKKPDSIEIIYANIVDSEIELTYGIRIGMNKREFLKRIFKNCNIEILKNINIVINTDFRDEKLAQVFIFQNDTLSKILMKIPGYLSIN